MEIRVFSFILFVLLLVSSPILQVVKCQVYPEGDTTHLVDGGDLGIVGGQFGFGTSSSAPRVHTVCLFPKNVARLVPAGEETELLVGVHNEGDLTLNVIAISASLRLPYDHSMLVQNLTTKTFRDASLPHAAQAALPYTFVVSEYLQPGTFDLVGAITYEIDQQPYQSFFYNGTIEVVEAGGVLNIEFAFLVTLGVAVFGFFGLWANTQVQLLSKKTKNAPKVEVGTRTTDANLDEWLQGTAYAQSLSNKSTKK